MSATVSTSVENPEPLCSICLEGVSGTCGRPVVTLLCSHVFHLDCIGSAFNVTGIMQCPNCRQIQKGEWLLFDTRDSESEMELNFNQDVGPRTRIDDHEENGRPYHGPVLALPAMEPRERDFIQVPLRTVFAGNHHRIALPVLIPEEPVTSPQNQGQPTLVGPVSDQTIEDPVQNEIIDLNRATVPDATFGAPDQSDAGGQPNNTADGPEENGDRYNDMGNLVQGESVPAAPAPPSEFNITQGGVTLNLPIHNDPQNEPQTTCILVAARIEEQDYFRN
ncbi:hypothetical protein Ddye_021046 [Dipteronia dyeriana]|uniref:RING-type domain-containing protein n=1 Tax=Dipteronia dyeriana TaxID=168575 RepID=A0AAD9U0X1_9ROSI|nr:hypothetical protein Ddye_021046 [Dipteronia dyeriana]